MKSEEDTGVGIITCRENYLTVKVFDFLACIVVRVKVDASTCTE